MQTIKIQMLNTVEATLCVQVYGGCIHVTMKKKWEILSKVFIPNDIFPPPDIKDGQQTNK